MPLPPVIPRTRRLFLNSYSWPWTYSFFQAKNSFSQCTNHAAGPDPGCNENHWHSSEAVPSFGFVAADGEFIVWDLTELPPGDVKKWQDPNPTGCGYGKVSEVMEVRLVTVTRIKLQAYYDVFGGPD